MFIGYGRWDCMDGKRNLGRVRGDTNHWDLNQSIECVNVNPVKRKNRTAFVGAGVFSLLYKSFYSRINYENE